MKTTESCGPPGYDTGKKAKGRKRRLAKGFEHTGFKSLQNMVIELIPILLAENGLLPKGPREKAQIPVHIAAHALSKATIAASADCVADY